MISFAAAALSASAGALFADDNRIGLQLKTMQEERYQRDRAAVVARAEEPGAEARFDPANNDELTQLARFGNMVAKGADGILFQPVKTGTTGSMVSMANSDAVRVLGYGSMLVDGPLDAMAMQDSWAVHRLQGEAMVEWLTERNGSATGQIALVQGQLGDSNPMAMSSGVLETVETNFGPKLVTNPDTEGWFSEKTMAIAESTPTSNGNQIDAFISKNIGLALGVITALEAQGLAATDSAFVAGSDSDLFNIRNVAPAKQAVETWKLINPLAETTRQQISRRKGCFALHTHLSRTPRVKLTSALLP